MRPYFTATSGTATFAPTGDPTQEVLAEISATDLGYCESFDSGGHTFEACFLTNGSGEHGTMTLALDGGIQETYALASDFGFSSEMVGFTTCGVMEADCAHFRVVYRQLDVDILLIEHDLGIGELAVESWSEQPYELVSFEEAR
ncbi:MAG: hypothetical protein H6737_23305 [Alphaproteobacteria bacterium]|nr:hypothetical protein [Alphaproteobacteria bacterium]